MGASYEQRTAKPLTVQNIRRICQTRIQEVLSLIAGIGRNKPIALSSWAGKKNYQAPVAKKLTPEQARLLLVGHATVGHQGARELMELVFPEPINSTEPRDRTTT